MRHGGMTEMSMRSRGGFVDATGSPPVLTATPITRELARMRRLRYLALFAEPLDRKFNLFLGKETT
jgi:hypothetical protein